MYGKKDSAGAGQISEKGKSHSKGNGKVIPFGPKAGQLREQREKGVGQKKDGPQKIFRQIEILFPYQANGILGAAGESAGDDC